MDKARGTHGCRPRTHMDKTPRRHVDPDSGRQVDIEQDTQRVTHQIASSQ